MTNTVATIVLVAGLLSAIPGAHALTNPQTIDSEFRNAVRGCNAVATVWLRASFHECGTFSVSDKSGGCDGSLQFENTRPENSGLQSTINFYSDLVRRFGISFADAAVYGGIVAVQECGGPNIPFKFGRTDISRGGPENRLPGPAATAQEIEDIFMKRMGFTLDETVALIGGGHTIGRVHSENTLGVNPGPMDTTSNRFDNIFFQNLLNQTPPGGITRLIADGNMVSNAQMKPVVEKFARDNNAFTSAFISAYAKMSDFGANFNPNQNNTTPNGNPNNGTSPGNGTGNGTSTNPNGSNGRNNGTNSSSTLPPLTQLATGINPIQVPVPTWAPVSNSGPVIPASPPGAAVVGVPESPAGRSAGNPKTDGSSFFAEIAASLLMLAPLILN